MCLSRRYRRSMERSLSKSPVSRRRFVMAAVMLLTKEEKTMSAKSSTSTAKTRSCVFRGTTSMEAGVNCVRLQWKLVKYL